MKKWLIVVLAFSLVLSFGATAFGQEDDQPAVPMVVVYLDSIDEVEALFDAGLDVFSVDPVNLEVEVVLNDYDREYLDSGGFFYEILVEDLTYRRPEVQMRTFGASVTGRTDYRTWDEFVYELYLLEELYPDFVKVHVIGHSVEDNPILALEISAAVGVDDGRPESYFCGQHHAREWPSGEMSLDLAWYLMLNYGEDERVTNIVDTIRLWVIPQVNPDGFLYSQNVEQMWRKSRSRNVDGSFGVDLNRNYAYGWGLAGASGVPSSATFRGVAPFSEPEIWGIRDLFLSRHIITAQDGHTHGRYILWPWGFTTDLPPHHDIFSYLGWQYQAYNQYPAARTGPIATTIYRVSGGSLDWQYGVTSSLAYCFEFGTSFIPPYMGTIATTPTLVTDLGNISGNMFTFSLPPEGQSGNLVYCGRGLVPGDFPAEVAGNIALIERGDDTFRNKALNAADAGAIGVVIYNNVSGSLSGTLGSAGVPIPVMGMDRANGLQLVGALEQGPVHATLEAVTTVTNSYAQEWERNLPAFLLNLEAAETFASVISGTVTDKLSGEPLEARLDMDIALRSVAAENVIIDEPMRTSITAPGSYKWYVLPSKQPLLETPPYTITASAPGMYSKTVELAVNSFQEQHQLDFQLQPVVELKTPITVLERIQPNSTIPFKFVTFDRDGVAVDMEDVTVTLLYGDEPVATYVQGQGARFIRGDEPGEYIVNINTRNLELDEGTYTLVIEFTGAEGVQSYATTFELFSQASLKEAA